MWGGLVHDLPVSIFAAIGVLDARQHEVAVNSPTIFPGPFPSGRQGRPSIEPDPERYRRLGRFCRLSDDLLRLQQVTAAP